MDAVRKSISIPGVLRPIVEKGQVIIDGGVLNPLPTNVLARMGTKKILAVNVLQSPEDVTKAVINQNQIDEEEGAAPFTRSPGRFIKHRINKFVRKLFMPNISDIIVNSLMASEYLISVQSAQQADIVIKPDLVGINWFELYKVDDLIESGYRATKDMMPQIKQLIAE